jgi:hypothetical protein
VDGSVPESRRPSNRCHAGALLGRVDTEIEAVAGTRRRADEAIAGVGGPRRRADEAISGVERTAARADRLVDHFEPALTALRRGAEEIAHGEATVTAVAGGNASS